MARTTRKPNEFAGPGANAQEGTLPLYRCNTCGADVVWATSARTGRKYLADVKTGQAGQRYYVKASAHECDNPARREAREAVERQMAAEAMTRKMGELQEARRSGEMTMAEYLAALEALAE